MYRLLLIILCAYCIILKCSSCANIIPPGGGPKDSLPPVLVKATPDVMSKNITPKKIILSFNEYIQLQELGKNLIVYPTPKNVPAITSHLKNVTINIKDTLKPNTTYVFELGNAIADINENNAINHFTYVFSTGDHIDSLTISGKVVLAETGKVDSTMIAVLHRKHYDSAVFKERPDYYTKINRDGYFHFRFLPKDSFDIYALKDETGTKKYISPIQLFAFNNKPVIAGEADSITLYAYAAEKETPKVNGTTPQKITAKDSLFFTTNVENGQQDILSNLEIKFNTKISLFDSSKIFLTDTQQVRNSIAYLPLDSNKQKITLTHTWKPNTKYNLIVLKGAVKDSAGKTFNKNDTISFITKKIEDYGSIKLKFSNLPENKSLVLMLIQNDQLVESAPIKGTEWYRKLFNPGAYDIRILLDKNGNGKWDPGDFKQRIQPEIVEPISQRLTIRANWDNELEIKL